MASDVLDCSSWPVDEPLEFVTDDAFKQRRRQDGLANRRLPGSVVGGAVLLFGAGQFVGYVVGVTRLCGLTVFRKHYDRLQV